MDKFEFPTNIRQIGSISKGLKIYMEDYVNTYLTQYAESGGYEEKLALLVGRDMIIDGQPVLFISGALQGRQCITENGITTFSKQSWDIAEDDMLEFFEDLEIVGWMQSQPGYGTFLNSNYAHYHMMHFTKPHQVLYVMDPIEKVNTFYTWNEKMDDLAETEGYFIFYEKNQSMHEYMLENKIIQMKKTTLKGEAKEVTQEGRREKFRAPIRRESGKEYALHKKPVLQEAKKTKQIPVENRKLLNMLVGLSAVLFVVCFVMGAGLIQNDDRISALEGELVQLHTAYKNLLVQANPDTAAVFAAQNDTYDIQESARPVEPPAPAPEETPEAASPSPTAQVITEDGNEALQTATPTPSPEPPEVEEEEKTAGVPDTYTVEQGDTLEGISVTFYGDKSMMDRIMELNGMDDPDKIFYGKVLLLP